MFITICLIQINEKDRRAMFFNLQGNWTHAYGDSPWVDDFNAHKLHSATPERKSSTFHLLTVYSSENL